MKPQRFPRVSVCIPTYNYGRYVGAAIESVLAQTCGDFELLVVDNCSTDTTKEVVARYVTQDERVAYFCNDRNLGMVGNWNRCLELATGEYVKILCADDVLVPDSLEKSVQVLDGYPGVVLVSGSRRVVDEQLRAIKTFAYGDSFTVVSGGVAITRCLLKSNMIGEPSAVLFRKNKAGRGFSPDYSQMSDLEMWFHLLEQGDFAFIPEVVCLFRQHEEQYSSKNEKSLASIDDLFSLYDAFSAKEYVTAGVLARHEQRFLNAYYAWKLQEKGVDKRLIKEKVFSYYQPSLFYLLLAIKQSKGFVLRLFRRDPVM